MPITSFENTECFDGKDADCNKTPLIQPGSPETISIQDEKSQEREENTVGQGYDLHNAELSASSSESPKRKKLNFSMFDTDTEEENRVFNSALDAIEDETSVPEDSEPDENSSQECSQKRSPPTTCAEITIAQNQDKASQEASVLRTEKHSGQTSSKKRPLSLTQDSSSQFYHKHKRPRSRMENLEYAINNDHPRSTDSRKFAADSDDQKSSAMKANSDMIHSGGYVKDEQIVIPETDDEQLKSGLLETFGLDQEDIDYWKEQGAAKKASTSKPVNDNKVAAIPLPESSMMLKTKGLKVPKKTVQFSVKSQDKPSKKGKSLKSTSQPSRRKKLPETHDSQSSDDFILSSQQDQDQNSEDEFKPKRSRRQAVKKSFK